MRKEEYILEDCNLLARLDWHMDYLVGDSPPHEYPEAVSELGHLAAYANAKAAQEEQLAPLLGYEIWAMLITVTQPWHPQRMPVELPLQCLGSGYWTIDRTLAVINSLLSAEQQPMALIRVAEHAPEARREDILREAHAKTRALRDAEVRVKSLQALLPLLRGQAQSSVLEEMLNTAIYAPYLFLKVAVAKEVSAWLMKIGESPTSDRQRLLQRAMALVEDLGSWYSEKAEALGALAPHFPVRERLQYIKAVLNRYPSGISSDSLSVYAHLAPVLPDPDRNKVVQILGQKLGPERLDLLLELIAKLPVSERAPLVDRTIGLLRSLQDVKSRTLGLLRLIPYVDEVRGPALLQEAYHTVTLREIGARAHLLIELLRHWPADERTLLLPEILDAIQHTENLDQRASYYLEVILLAPAKEHGALIEALLALMPQTTAQLQVRTALTLLPMLPQATRVSLVKDVVDTVRTTLNGVQRAVALGAVAEKLPAPEAYPLLQEALDCWTYTGDRNDFTAAQERLEQVPDTPTGLHPSPLTIDQAWESVEGYWVAESLAVLSAQLEPDDRPTLVREALLATEVISDSFWRGEALASQLAESDRQPLLAQVMDEFVDELYYSPEWSFIDQRLVWLVPHLSNLSLCNLYPLWRQMVYNLLLHMYPYPRRDVVATISRLGPVIQRLGGRGAVKEAARALENIAGWWP